MKLIKLCLLAVLPALTAYSLASYANSPVGVWQTIDDVSGKPKAIVEIQQGADNSFMGKILKVFPQPGKSRHELCAECKGDKHNQPIVGMSIISGLKAVKQNQWGKGEILDPANGKTYSCHVRMTDSGDKLNVRGYIGMPLLGRTQTWVRVKEVG